MSKDSGPFSAVLLVTCMPFLISQLLGLMKTKCPPESLEN